MLRTVVDAYPASAARVAQQDSIESYELDSVAAFPLPLAFREREFRFFRVSVGMFL